MKENVFSRKVTEYLQSKGAIVNNQTGGIFSKVGVSDLLVCYNGYFIALELKTMGYQPDPLQIRYLQQVRNAGGYGLLLRDSLDDLYDLLQYLDELDTREYQGFEDIYYTYEQPDLQDITDDKLEVWYD